MSAGTWVREKGADEPDPDLAKIAERAREEEAALAPPEPADHDHLRDEAATTYYDDVLKIPGYGDAPTRCRPLTPVGVCMEGHPVLGRSSCGARYCPDHWRDWCENATISVVARLAAWREANHPQAGHVVASPPPGRYSQRALWDGRSDSYGELEAAGMPGGAAVAHPFGVDDGGKELYQTAKEAGELPESTGIWRFLREISGEDWGEMQRHIEGRPHYHAVGPIGEIVPEAASEEWIIERIRTFQPFHYRDTEAYRDMAASVYYVLTHGAAQQGRQTTTYFGAVHPANFSPSETLTAAKWDRIQREAVKAVTQGPRDDADDAPTHGPAECPRDECGARVRPFRHLRDLMADEDWRRRVQAGREGRQRWLRLRGMLAWWEERADRPPPGVQASEARMLEWLEDLGRRHTAAPRQAGFGPNSATFGTG